MTLVFSLLAIVTLVMSGCRGGGSSSSFGMPETPVMPEGGDDDGEVTGIETMLTEDEQATAAMRMRTPTRRLLIQL